MHPIQKMFEGKELTAPEKIKLFVMCQNEDVTDYASQANIQPPDDFQGYSVTEVFAFLEEYYNLCEDLDEFRCSGIETNLQRRDSRYYESESVAAQVLDGSWVGWTYWYGGGKHGEPEAVEWLEDAYNLECQEEEQVVVVRTFTKPL
jgi:hypothetical protein